MKKSIALILVALGMYGCAEICAHIPTTPIISTLPGLCPTPTPTPMPVRMVAP